MRKALFSASEQIRLHAFPSLWLEATVTTTLTVPVTITPDVAARIAELGIQGSVERMLDYARQRLPGLQRIEVVLCQRYELGDQPGLGIEAYSRCPFDTTDQTDRDLDRWMVTEFPPEILEHVTLSYRPGAPDAG
jgi:hypothetical protein